MATTTGEKRSHVRYIPRARPGRDGARCRSRWGFGGPLSLRRENPPSAGQSLAPLRELIDDRLLDALLERSRDEAGGPRLTGAGSLLGELVKAVLERALGAGLTAHLGYERHHPAGHNTGNSRNGTISKQVQTGIGPVPRHPAPPGAGVWHPAVARDHLADHRRGARRGAGVAGPAARPGLRRGVPSRDRGRVRDNHVVQTKPAYLAVGIDGDGEKARAGHLAGQDPAGYRHRGGRRTVLVLDHDRPAQRGVRDILIACCDGLAGFEDAIHSAFPATTVQRCVVHLIRNALRPVARRDAAAVAAGLRAIYTAPGEEAALDALAGFAASPLGQKYPQAVRVWEDAWDAFTPFLAFSPPVRKLLYTTNSIESLNYQLRKVTKARGHFPSDHAVVKLLWLAIINIEDKRARERAARRQETGKRHDQPVRLIEGQRVTGWREARRASPPFGAAA